MRGPWRTGEIARRLDVDDNWASQYRRRMIDAELIRPTRRGEFDFELPYLREGLRSIGVQHQPRDLLQPQRRSRGGREPELREPEKS